MKTQLQKSTLINYFKLSCLVLISTWQSHFLYAQNLQTQKAQPKLVAALSPEGSAIANKLSEQAWFLNSQAQDVRYDLNPLISYILKGRENSDIHRLTKIPSPLKLEKIKVAVIDTGVDVNHPYLVNRIARNQKECELYQKIKTCAESNSESQCLNDNLTTDNSNRDADGNGYPGDCIGWNLVDAKPIPGNILGNPLVEDTIGHGTHVAGVIAQVSPMAEIIPVQVVGDKINEPIKPFSFDMSPDEGVRGGLKDTENLSQKVSRAIIYAFNSGAQVINLSIGWPEVADSDDLKQAIETVVENGVIVVAAAGNDSTTALLRPCQYKGVICVAATRPDGTLANFSNYGYGVDIAAPGVSILSTIPNSHRSIRVPSFNGLDMLSGTSQATPIITGVIANLLSLGVPTEEIYPRLMVSAKKITDNETSVLAGNVHGVMKPVDASTLYRRFVLSGLVDETAAFQAQPQPFIATADKEVHLIEWDRHSQDLSFSFKVKNYWQDINHDQVEFFIEYSDLNMTEADKKSGVAKKLLNSKILPLIVNAHPTETLDDESDEVWSMGEEKTLTVNLKIQDSLPEFSQIPSDLHFKVTAKIKNAEVGLKIMNLTQVFETRAEVVVPLKKDVLGADLKEIPLVSDAKVSADSFYLVDEVYDQKQNERDYFSIKGSDTDFTIRLVKFQNGQYIVGPPQTVPLDGVKKYTRPVRRMRLDLNFDGHSEYVLTIKEAKLDEDQNPTNDYYVHFYIFDENMKLIERFKFFDERAVMPLLDFYWVKVLDANLKPLLRPAWVGQGYPIRRVIKQSEFLKFRNEDDKLPDGQYAIRFYYLNANNKLESYVPFLNQDGDVDNLHRIVDILTPSNKQVESGVLPVLIAKSAGTEMQSGYVNSFTIGYVSAVQNSAQKLALMNTQVPLKGIDPQVNYRNLIDTRVGTVSNLASDNDEFRGTFWFGPDAHNTQRVTMLENSDQGLKLTDEIFQSKNKIFDSGLLVRSGYAGQKIRGVYLITNTEIEFHEFNSHQAVQTSLNKYTFIGDNLTANLQFPIAIKMRNSSEKYPALFTTEGSKLNFGVKMLVPVFASTASASQGGVKLEQLISPARLHTKSPEGCRALDTPVFLGGADGYALDYYCGNKFIRQYLKY